jgi:hypothetical protein
MTNRNAKIAEDLVTQAREELQRMLGSETEPEPEPDGEFDWDRVARVVEEMKRSCRPGHRLRSSWKCRAFWLASKSRWLRRLTPGCGRRTAPRHDRTGQI